MVSAKKKALDTKRFHHNTGQLFTDQYYHIYNARLQVARGELLKNSRFRWGEDIKNVPLEQLNSSLGSTDVFVIGTLFKIMPEQPSILRELEVSNMNESQIDDETSKKLDFNSDQDSLVLHETDENVKVVGEIDIYKHVTGIPVSLLGHQLNDGAQFYVTDICYAGPDLSVFKETMPKASCYKEEGKGFKLLLISGLEFGFDDFLNKERSGQIIEGLKKLRKFVSGGHDDISNKGVSKIIIAGNSVGPGYTKAQIELNHSSQTKNNKTLKEVFHMFDKYLFTLAQSGCEIHVMPGKNDPTSFLLPQQPFHPKLLPQSGSLENILPETNPCLLEYKNSIILGSSGENVEAILKYSRIEHGITALKNTLEWGHMAPSTPDNLSCVPFKDRDPFMIDFIPDIYFAGNQPEYSVTTFSAKTKPKIQIITVPSFVKTLSCVQVDMESLETELINFE